MRVGAVGIRTVAKHLPPIGTTPLLIGIGAGGTSLEGALHDVSHYFRSAISRYKPGVCAAKRL